MRFLDWPRLSNEVRYSSLDKETLAEAGRKAAREMNVFLYVASDSHNFPTTYGDLEKEDEDTGFVREEPGIYLASSR